jgi:hypothetical protein
MSTEYILLSEKQLWWKGELLLSLVSQLLQDFFVKYMDYRYWHIAPLDIHLSKV